MAAPVLWGSELSVDLNQTEGVQSDTSVIAFADGSFLAVWADYKAGGDIVGQFLAADGTHKGEAFLVTNSLAGSQGAPQAALLNDGRYVVAWSTNGNTDKVGVWARIFSPQGQGGEDLYVGQAGFTGALSLSVSSLTDGFAVSYAYSASPLSSPNMYAYSFGANGTPSAPEVRVNGTLGRAGYESDVVELDNGQYAVFFEGDKHADDPDGDIRCRVFSATGEETVSEFRVSVTRAGQQWSPSAARLSDGRIAVIWQHEDEATGDKSGSSIRGRIINPKDWTSGPEFQVNLTTVGEQGNPQLTALADGGFAVTYRHVPDPINGGGEDIRIVCFDDNGTARGEIRVTADSRASEPTVTALADGRLLVTWTAWTSDDLGNPKSDIRAQIVDPRSRGVDLAGTSGDDHHIGSTFADSLSGGGGHDRLRGEGGNDVLNGGAGADTLEGGAGADTLSGSADNDTYIIDALDRIIEAADGGVDTVQSSASYTLGEHLEHLNATGQGAITLTGNALGNVIKGNASANTLDGGAGADHLLGGAGHDTYVVDGSDQITELAHGGSDTVLTGTSWALGAHLEHLTATGSAAIHLTGSELDNVLTGNAGANTLEGQAGNDMMVGGAGADAMMGGSGNDTYYVDQAGDLVVEHAGQGSDTVYVNTAVYALGAAAEVETLVAGVGAVNLTGSNFANAISGNSLSNSLWGQAGNDQLAGDSGDDRLYGGLGNDRIAGSLGNDPLKGEAGRDVFVFDTALHKTRNVDKVYDFRSRDDSFHLDNAIFTKLGRGSAAGVRFKSDMFVEGTRAKDREDRIVYDKKTGALYYDQDGTGSKAQVKIATLTNKTALKYHDFFVI